MIATAKQALGQLHLILIVALMVPSAALAQNLEGVTENMIRQIEQELPRLQQDTVYYHWIPTHDTDRFLRWVRQGLSQGEMDFLTRPNPAMAAGGGLYLAGSYTSSKAFGDLCVAITIRKGTPILDAQSQLAVERIIGRPLVGNEEKAELGKRIPFVHQYNWDWFVVHDLRPVSYIESATNYGVRFQLPPGVSEESLAPRGDPATEDFHRRLQHWLRYVDTVSLMRSIQANPMNIWSDFEPQNFGRFMQTREDILNRADTGKTGISSRVAATLGGSQSADSWIRNQLKDVLPSLHSGLSGDGSGFRAEGIRAGGDEPGRRFFVTGYNLAVLNANPYLEVRAERVDGGFLVEIYYPDVFHFRKLKGLISQELYDSLNSSQQKLKQDATLRQSLNQRLISELMTDLLRRHHETKLEGVYGSGFQRVMEMYSQMISIHPFSDFNGRTVRLWFEAAYREAGFERAPVFNMISDFDLLLSPGLNVKLLNKWNRFWQKLPDAFDQERVRALRSRQIPSYFDLPIWSEILSAVKAPLSVTPAPIPFSLMQSEMEMIRTRRFVQLFSGWHGRDWTKEDAPFDQRGEKLMRANARSCKHLFD